MTSGTEEPEGAGGARPTAGGEAGAAEDDDGDHTLEATGSCELCGGPTYERHCKIVCFRCGYMRDCSDP